MQLQTKNITPYQDINEILTMLSNGLKEALGDQLVGVYLTGSLTYGDFDRGSSDIDFLVVLKREFSKEQRRQVEALHNHLATAYPFWAERVEGGYITEDMLSSIKPPAKPRPYVNGGKLWNPDPRYGNEWLLNLFVLRKCGVALIGPSPKKLIKPVDINLVREASNQDFYKEWQPLLKDASGLKDSHIQAYVTLTLCRILHRAKNNNVVSKRGAAAWVKQTYGKPWSELIEKAEGWKHGTELNVTKDILAFIRLVDKELTKEAGKIK